MSFQRGMNALRNFDLSIIVLVIVLTVCGAGIWQLGRAFPDADRGLIIYAREQKEIFIDAGLIPQSYRVRSPSGLDRKLRAQTVIVAARVSPHRAFEGAGVILGVHQGRIEILTAKHVVAHHGQKLVIFPDHTERNAVRVILAPDNDLALVLRRSELPHTKFSSAHLADQTFANGQEFVVMGHPGPFSWFASPGLAEHHLDDTLLFCPTCDKGDSGAGAFDGSGNLRGILVNKAIIRVLSTRTGQSKRFTAYQIEQPKAIRAFLRTAH